MMPPNIDHPIILAVVALLLQASSECTVIFKFNSSAGVLHVTTYSKVWDGDTAPLFDERWYIEDDPTTFKDRLIKHLDTL